MMTSSLRIISSSSLFSFSSLLFSSLLFSSLLLSLHLVFLFDRTTHRILYTCTGDRNREILTSFCVDTWGYLLKHCVNHWLEILFCFFYQSHRYLQMSKKNKEQDEEGARRSNKQEENKTILVLRNDDVVMTSYKDLDPSSAEPRPIASILIPPTI